MERTGEVTAVNGEWLEITFCRPADCEKCHACIGGPKTISVKVRGKANPGDFAVVQMAVKTVTAATLLAYGLPLVGLMAGMFLGEWLLPAESSLGGILGGAVGLLLPIAGLLLTEKRRQKDPRWEANLLRVIPRTNNN